MMRDPRLEQHRTDGMLQEISEAAAHLAAAEAMVAGLAGWCRDVLFATDVLDPKTKETALGLSLRCLPPNIRTMHSAPLRILGNDNPSKRRSGALIEGRDYPQRDVMGWLFGKALVSALQQDSERDAITRSQTVECDRL